MKLRLSVSPFVDKCPRSSREIDFLLPILRIVPRRILAHRIAFTVASG